MLESQSVSFAPVSSRTTRVRADDDCDCDSPRPREHDAPQQHKQVLPRELAPSEGSISGQSRR